ncbi:major facilitator superfamily domain-containing protein [Epithele typhae]|uniref:major facilitator superfamily domain-containing protein n=1 Tax=Epithele typhae TaxID=378194 RepID=UPI0020088F2A|nr:major facilitator superfamily domain-containing protein [Epithele typhae]KAH9914900.1 major facilitator superfamily domain-containing protein [Epithele typhae]
MSIVAPLYGISLFLPSIINGFGFNTTISQLLTVPPYVVATITLLLWAFWSDRIKKRYPFILAGLDFGTFLVVTGAYAGFPGIIAWLGNNLVGHYKRGMGMALQIGIGNFSGAVASNIYRTQDAPRYALGHGIELMFVGIGLVAVPIAVLSYKRINARRESEMREANERGFKYSPEELRRMGDRAPDFRYTL